MAFSFSIINTIANVSRDQVPSNWDEATLQSVLEGRKERKKEMWFDWRGFQLQYLQSGGSGKPETIGAWYNATDWL